LLDQMVQEQTTTLRIGELLQAAQYDGLLWSDAFLAVPGSGQMSPMSHRPRAIAQPLLRVSLLGNPIPLPTRGNEGVAYSSSGRGRITGECNGLKDQSAMTGLVQLAEIW